MTYKAAVSQAPFSIRPHVSRAKDENVVNPPQIPTFSNSTSFGEDENCFNASAAASPIRKQQKQTRNNQHLMNAFKQFMKESDLMTLPMWSTKSRNVYEKHSKNPHQDEKRKIKSRGGPSSTIQHFILHNINSYLNMPIWDLADNYLKKLTQNPWDI